MFARSYTRAREFLFDSDDEAHPPKAHPATPEVWRTLPPQLGCISSPPQLGCISPPHSKQVRCSVEAISARLPSAGSAPAAKVAAKTSTIELPLSQSIPKQPPKRPSTHSQPTRAELGSPPSPAVSAPKPAKGCLKDMHGRPLHRPNGMPYPCPHISKGFDHVGDGALWRWVAVHEHGRKTWPLWGRGVVDLRPQTNARSMVAGRLLRHALSKAKRIINMAACEHKIGMCRCPCTRFMCYQESAMRWQPVIMCLLGSTSTREGSWYLEAALILDLETNSVNINHNINWTSSCDYGGEGPKADDESHCEHYVYLAVRPLPIRLHQPIDGGGISP